MKRDPSAAAHNLGDVRVRLDKWLWAARFYKTRSLSGEEIDKGRVRINGQAAKASSEVRAGDEIEMRIADSIRTVRVLGVSGVRGSAPVAALLYQETEASRAERERRMDLRRWGAEPASTLKGRPTKRDRRLLELNGALHVRGQSEVHAGHAAIAADDAPAADDDAAGERPEARYYRAANTVTGTGSGDRLLGLRACPR